MWFLTRGVCTAYVLCVLHLNPSLFSTLFLCLSNQFLFMTDNEDNRWLWLIGTKHVRLSFLQTPLLHKMRLNNNATWLAMLLHFLLQCWTMWYVSHYYIEEKGLSIIRSLWLFWHATFYSSWFSVISGAHKRRFTVASSSSQFIDTSVIQRL